MIPTIRRYVFVFFFLPEILLLYNNLRRFRVFMEPSVDSYSVMPSGKHKI